MAAPLHYGLTSAHNSRPTVRHNSGAFGSFALRSQQVVVGSLIKWSLHLMPHPQPLHCGEVVDETRPHAARRTPYVISRRPPTRRHAKGDTFYQSGMRLALRWPPCKRRRSAPVCWLQAPEAEPPTSVNRKRQPPEQCLTGQAERNQIEQSCPKRR